LRQETLMHGAMAFPQNETTVAQLLLRVAAELFKGIPHGHFVQTVTETVGSVPSQMLIREKENLVRALQPPPHHRSRIRGGADGPAVASTERFDCGRGIHV